MIIILLFSGLILSSCTQKTTDFGNRNRDFNIGWKFIKDSVIQAENPDFDDSAWRTVDLPHDWSIEDLPGEDSDDKIGPFLRSSPGGRSEGYLVGGTAWYRKHFTLESADKDKTVILKFDGVSKVTDVWVNGKKAGENKYGYSPFWFDITQLLNPAGESNVVAVKVENVGQNTRWYAGSGIYRNVQLVLTEPVHVAQWGVYITTPEIQEDNATVDIEVTTQNDGAIETEAVVKIKILDKNKQLLGEAESSVQVNPNSTSIANLQMSVEDPELWSIETPNMYEAVISVEVNNSVVDSYNQSFGIRTIEITPENGFVLNGETVLLKGGCLHHDNGLLGAAAFDRAEVRRIEILKANGYNAIRCSHNPPSEAFLNACDSLGMLVIDEFVDMWEQSKTPNDYSQYFHDWWQRDAGAMILRDRNHPSIVLWSIGNEIREKITENGLRIEKELLDFFHKMDNTRMVTEAIDLFQYEWDENAEAMALLDVGGYNYQWARYEEDHEKYPDRIMLGTESIAKEAYENWEQVEKLPYVIGDFIWTAMDYLGENGLGNTRYVTPQPVGGRGFGFGGFGGGSTFPATYIAWCGDIDITGEKKPQMFYRDVIWDNSKLEINVHAPIPEGMIEQVGRWGWPDELPMWYWSGSEGDSLQIRVFTKADFVKLELNGEVIGEKDVSKDSKYIAEFKVLYSPGELKAIAYKDGEEIAVKSLTTPGNPAAIRLTADRNVINADRNDLSFVKIEVVDENGQVVPRDDVKIELTISGNGELIASGNASKDGMESFHEPVINSFRGKAQAIIRPYATPGEIVFTAKGENLVSGELRVTVK